MNLTSLSQVRHLIEKTGITPSKGLGQNFLIDKNILDILLEQADLSGSDEVLEIGPGFGVVTERLLGAAGRVVAIEKDARLAGYLSERFDGESRLELLSCDALDVDLGALGVSKVVSNLPYSAGSRILVELSKLRVVPDLMVVTVQNEVARRIVAEADNREYGLLSLWLQLDYSARIVKKVSRTCFWPRPEVVSTIVALKKRARSHMETDAREFFYKLTKHAFSHRRKQLVTILRHAPQDLGVSRDWSAGMMEELGLDGRERPGNLSVEKWCELSEQLKAGADG